MNYRVKVRNEKYCSTTLIGVFALRVHCIVAAEEGTLIEVFALRVHCLVAIEEGTFIDHLILLVLSIIKVTFPYTSFTISSLLAK